MTTENIQSEQGPERAIDMEITDFLSKHIDEPCEVEVYPGQVENIRDFYIREAERILPTFVDLEAAKKLQEKINEYKK